MRFFTLYSVVFTLVFMLVSSTSFAQKPESGSKNSGRVEKSESKASASRRLFGDYREKTTQFYYSRAEITIIRKSIPKNLPPSLPWLVDEPPPDPALVFDVEIRDGMSMYNQNGWFDMSSYSDNTGMMMVFSEPVTEPIIRSTQYSPVDILFIDKQGKIIQIAPNIMLSDLESNIVPNSPVLAFLFIKGGSSSALYINVGDEVQYSLFKKPPLILNAPREEPPAPAPKMPPKILNTIKESAPKDDSAATQEPKADNTKPETAQQPAGSIILQKDPDELQKRQK